MADERTVDELDDMRNQEQSMEEQVTTKHEPDADVLVDLEAWIPSDVFLWASFSNESLVTVPLGILRRLSREITNLRRAAEAVPRDCECGEHMTRMKHIWHCDGCGRSRKL